jgi:hypothetical protein
MKNFLLMLTIVVLASCGPKTEKVSIIKGDDGKDGTSCSVAPEYSQGDEYELIGAKISCTDGSFAIIYNGEKGDQGIQGNTGSQGIQGPQGIAGKSCQAYRSILFSGVWLACPNQLPVLISDGNDGRDGTSCTSSRLRDKVEIRCGRNVSYVYDGRDGSNGTSCTAVAASGGANITCGSNQPVFLANGAIGPQGAVGPQGQAGRDGLNGKNGEDAIRPGLSCNLHDLRSWDKNTSLPQALANNPAIGNFILPNLNIPDSQAVNGFPGMPKALQDLVGIEGYALDCNGYLNIQTSGQHTLKLLSDDGSRLSIEDDYLVIENQGLHAPVTKSITGNLNRGQNKINVVYYQGPVTQIALELRLSGPNTLEAVVPASAFTH